MASRLFRWSSNALVVARPNVRRSVCARKFSSWDEPKSANEDFVIQIVSHDDSSFRWPETRLGLLEPKDHRFPFPGLVGSTSFQPKHSSNLTTKQQKPQYDADVLVAELPYERQSSAYEQYMTVNKQAAAEGDNQAAKDVKSTPFDRLECAAHDCPVLLRKDFFDMFPNSHVHPLDSLTVITFCQKSDAIGKLAETPMPDIHTDFIAAATRVCEDLHNCGFWADFIDPLSGRPYLGIQTNIAFYEVDERYRRFGFEIDDSVERCRVLRHHALGSRPFVGCVFTSAPTGHPYIIDLARTRKARSASAVD